MRKSSEAGSRSASLHRSPRFFLLAVILALSGFPAFSQNIAATGLPLDQPALVPDFTGIISLSVNGTPRGDIEAGILGDEPLLQVEFLKGLLSNNIRPDIYDTIFNVVLANLTWAGKDELSLVGMGWAWDPNSILLDIIVPPSYGPIQDIDTSPLYTVNLKPIFKPEPVSGFFNFDLNATADYSSDTPFYSFDTTAKGTVNVLDWVAEISGTARAAEGIWNYSLNSWRILHDFPWVNGRLYAGRVPSPGLSYQSQPEILGLTLNHEEILKYKVKPGFYELFSEFTLESTSIVRIILNNAVYRTVTLNPGNYRLLDLPFASGLNEFILEIEDQNGQIQRRNAFIPRESNLLVVGNSEYSVSAGVGRLEMDQPFVTGYFRYGFTPRFTAGFMGQADLRSALAGGSAVMATEIGSFTGALALMGAWDGRDIPFSGASTLQYRFVIPGSEYMPAIGMSAEYVAPGFAAPSPSATFTPASSSLRLGGQMGGKLARVTSYSTSIYWSKVWDGSDNRQANINLSLNQSLGSGTSMSIISNVGLKPTSTPEITVTLMLFILPKNKPGRSMSFIQTNDGGNNISYIDKLDILGGLDFGLRSQDLLPGSPDPSTMGLSLRKSFDWLDTAVAADLAYGGGGDPALRFQASGSTALAFAGRHLGITRQVDDSFVIFAPAKDMAEQNVYMRVEESGSVVSRNARTVILPLTSYKATAAYMEMPEAPPDILPRIQAALLAPHFRSGILYASDILRRYSVAGTLELPDGAVAEYIAGDIVDASGTNLTSTFTDELGNFEVYDLLPGTYTIYWPDFVGYTTFEVPESEESRV
jgi:outer membrane usher protein